MTAARGCECDRFPNTPRCSPELAAERGCASAAAMEAAVEFVKLAEERPMLVASHRRRLRENLRTGSA